jgi:flagellar biosynthesis/type III secretory pathway protein FliH
MSKQNNKNELESKTNANTDPGDNKDNSYNQKINYQSSNNDNYRQLSSDFNNNLEKSAQSVNQALEESKRSIERNTDEARNQIPRYAQAITDAQEQTTQATKEIAENYLEYQKQAINSFQSVFSPYFENVHNQLWNNQDFYRRIPEIYSKIISNYTENTIALSRVINDIAFSNVNLFKNAVNEAKEHSKHLAEIGKRNVRVYEGIGKDNRDV